MTLQSRPLSEELPAPLPASPGRGRWNWQRLAQVIWIILALVLLVNFVASIPAYYQSSRTGCRLPDPSNCPTGLLTPGNVQALAQLHLSVTVVASFLATLTLAVSVLYWLVGLLIFWRKSQEWVGLFFSLVCIMMGAIGIYGFPGATQTPPLFQLMTTITSFLLTPLGIAFFFTFPTVRFTPRWTWAVFVLVSVLNALPFIPSIVTNAMYPILFGVQIYRYVRVYDGVQRQQTKWFVFGLVVGFSCLAIYSIFGALVPSLSASDSWYQLLNALTWLSIWTLLLLSVGIAILRYRLWDIDVIINRTLVYGSLSALLALLYIGLIFGLRFLFRGMFRQNSGVAIVVSTLVIAALFQPLRHRIQTIIDHRFYRRKYNARRIIANFSATLRGEVDLTELREQLIAVVEETMQPAHVSLWLN